MFWRPDIDPAVLCLTSGDYAPDALHVAADPRRWRGRVAVIGSNRGDGRHVVLQVDGASFRLWLTRSRRSDARGFGVWLPFDRYFAERAALAISFWQSAADPPVSAATVRAVMIVPPQTGRTRRRILRAVDARLAGASYREIAAALFGEAEVGNVRDWKNHPTRAVVIRLVRTGLRLINGGYLGLLLPVKRAPRRCKGGRS